MDNHTQARFNNLIKHFGGLTPDMTAEDVYQAFSKLIPSKQPERGKIGKTIMQQRDELYSISKDWKRDLSDFISRKEAERSNLEANSKGLINIRFQAYQLFSNTDYKLHDIRLKNFSQMFFEALHYDRSLDIQNKVYTEDYFALFIITIFQMGDLYHSLPILKDELQKLEHGKIIVQAYTSLKEIFVSEDAYNDIMKLLSKEEMTDKDTCLWIDKANGYKSRIVALLNDLFYKGYYNTDQMPMPETLMGIALNTFGVDISKRMFHSENIPTIRKEYFYFIPKYTTK